MSVDFENFIILCILLNSLMLAIYDYGDRENLTSYNKKLEKVGTFFSYIFIFECIAKISSMGFVLHRNSYLRDAWNFIDLIVVISSIIEMLPGDASADSLKALRVLRVFRPLRSIKTLPQMR